MSLVRLTEDLFEKFTLVTNPRRTFISSSLGTTGSVYLKARTSTSVKEVEELGTFLTSSFSEGDIETLTSQLSEALSSSIASGGGDVSVTAQLYLDGVNDAAESALNAKQLTVARFTPPTDFARETLKKSAILNAQMPFYRPRYPEAQFAFTNYHCLNFFTASSVPNSSALIYPNSASNDPLGARTRPYNPSGSFTIDFYINPRYTSIDEADEFHAGTILHLSSTYCVSLVTGSNVHVTGKPRGFRLLLQLSHSADTAPSDINLATANNARAFPDDLTFVSSDNSLLQNRWHHVSIRWGTTTTNSGTGSFVIDGTTKGRFNVPSASISSTAGSDGIVVGNFFDGPSAGLAQLFNATAATTEGVTQLSAGTTDPTLFGFSHPLNAEVHDLKVFKEYRATNEMLTSSMRGPEDLSDLLFYVPPFFVRESRSRTIPVSPFYTRTGETYDSFNVDYSMGVGGHLVNLENYTREFVKGEYPRLFQLTASTVAGTLEASLSANDYLMATGSIKKRNLTILPCDNGLFVPNFDLLASGTLRDLPSSGTATEKFVSDFGAYNNRLITLRNLISTSSLRDATSGAFDAEVEGPNPEALDAAPADVLAIFQRTRDNTSNQVVFFDVSNILYGRRILPGTLYIRDQDLTGSDAKVDITLKDNGNGSLYRADSDTPHAEWASVGNVFYNEGIVLVKSPNLPLFGKDYHSLDFQGESQIHVMRINVPCPAGNVNSSSNPSFQPVSATLNANDSDASFVYITGLAFHDDNLNIVMRTNLAQPVAKRTGDKFLFRPKIDF